METLYIVDVANLFYRAFWGLEALSTPDGRPTQALHGFLSMLNSIIRENKPTYIALALESKTPSWRKLKYADYKGNRTEPNPDLTFQLNQLPELLAALNYPTFQLDGFEADDIIGSLATQGKQLGLQVFIVSSDKDFSQLVDGNIKLYDHMKNVVYGPDEIFAKYGVRPDQFTDYLSIVGDSSDNIKGVVGIGPKGAMNLLQKYETLDGVLQNIDKLKPAEKKKIAESAANIPVARELTKIVTNGIYSLSKDMLVHRGYNVVTLKDFLNRFGLRQHLVNMLGESAKIDTIEGLEIGKRV